MGTRKAGRGRGGGRKRCASCLSWKPRAAFDRRAAAPREGGGGAGSTFGRYDTLLPFILTTASITGPRTTSTCCSSGRLARTIIMSDVGGINWATNVTLTLDDAAAPSLPDSGQLVTGSFPTNVD